MTRDDWVLVFFAALTVGLAVAWTTLLTACVRLRTRPVPGRRWLTVAGAVGALGPAAGVGLFHLVAAPDDDEAMRNLAQSLIFSLPATQLAALLCGCWGLRRSWRAAEGWDRPPGPPPEVPVD